ncbi:MAG TPA: type III-B CRISPR module RAMP protein Cmr6, partial [Allocoleopsis sp.]
PPWRGCTFYISSKKYPELTSGDTGEKCAKKMRSHLKEFYQLLEKLTGEKINYQQLKEVQQVTKEQWAEAADKNCQIVICKGKEKFGKPFALSILHDEKFKVRGDYDGNLCGRVRGNVKPSPVWIADLGKYQIVTIFGANMNPRKEYLKELKDHIKVFPFN